MFHSARVRLTFAYVGVLAIILFISSGSIYSAFSRRLERRFERFAPRMAVIVPEGTIPPNAAEVRNDLIRSLLLVNGILLLTAGFWSYYLAGLTLEPIQAAYDRQKRFLSDASHELRTPLAILHTGLENELHDKELSQDAHERARNHLEEVQRMGRLVNDLLLLSRLDEEADARIEIRDMDACRVVQEAIDRLRDIADQRNVSLDVNGLPTTPLTVKANEDLLLRALTNVIKNAITYNIPGGRVTTTLTSSPTHALVQVTDTGPGIAHDDIKKIFDRFYRADRSRSRDTGGSGLGLAIVQSSMERMNGGVDIKSEPGRGTTVTLSLPLSHPS